MAGAMEAQMKPSITGKALVVTLLSWAVFSGIVVSCSSLTGDPVSTEGPATGPTGQPADPEDPYGVSVVASSLCSDGIKTTLVLQTDLDAEFWQLSADHVYPRGKTYVETSIIFLENDELYSTSSSGTRDDPVFDPQSRKVSTVQAFVFPRSPLPDSEFTVRARVYLNDLPAAYTPPAGVSFVEPGIIEVPVEYAIFPTLRGCP